MCVVVGTVQERTQMKLVVVFCLLLGLYEYIVWQVDLPPFCNHGAWTVAQKGTEERTPLTRNVLFLISQINSLPHFLGAFAAATTKKVWMCLYFLLLLWFTGAQVYVGNTLILACAREILILFFETTDGSGGCLISLE